LVVQGSTFQQLLKAGVAVMVLLHAAGSVTVAPVLPQAAQASAACVTLSEHVINMFHALLFQRATASVPPEPEKHKQQQL
jgi:hypothetical protein